MNEARIFIEPSFSIERRKLMRRPLEMPPQPDFLLIHFLKSQIPNLPAGASLLANPNQSLQVITNQMGCDLLLLRLTPELVVETAARLRMHREGLHLLFRRPLIPVIEDARLRGALDLIAKELETADAGWREVIRSLVHQLAVYLL